MFGAKPKGTFRPYQPSEPQPRGAVTRRAVAQRRSRASGLTRLSAAAIRAVWFGFWTAVHERRFGHVAATQWPIVLHAL